MANSAWGLDLSSWVSVQNHAKELHDALELFLNSEKTFFTKLSSFDLVVYAYLKEEMINTKLSEVVDYLNNNCPNLLAFVKHLDQEFSDNNLTNTIKFRLHNESTKARLYNSLLQRQPTQKYNFLDTIFDKISSTQPEDSEED